MALTFDAEAGEDLPGHNLGAHGWAATLDVLEREDVTGTFFLQANWAARHPDLARRTRNGGHLLGNHTLNHLDLGARPDLVDDQVATAGRVITAVTGANVAPWFRLPYFGGNTSARVLDALSAAGREHVDRNCEARDWELETNSAAVVVDDVLSDAEHVDGALVVLLHTWPAPSAAGTDLLLQRLRDRGAEFVAVDQLSRQERARVSLLRERQPASCSESADQDQDA